MTGRPIIFWGASGHAKVLNECVQDLGYRLVALFDNQAGLSTPIAGVPVYIGWNGFQNWSEDRPAEVNFLIAIGGNRGRDRMTLAARLMGEGLAPVTLVHRTAFVARSSTLGAGSQVLAGATVGVEARVGDQCIINTGASIDHECKLGNGVHVAPGATVCGVVEIEDYVLIGAGAVVLPRVRVGQGAVIGAGAVVLSDVPAGAVMVGNPARVVERKAA